MSTRRGPSAIDVRHVAAAIVLAACVAGTVLGHSDSTHVLLVWSSGLLYLAFCMEPMRRVLKTARVTWAFATVFVVVTVCCVGFVSCLPADADRGPGSFSLASRAFGDADLSTSARNGFLTATWLCFVGLAVGTLVLWYQVLRLARRTEWQSIDHTTGDASFLTGATLQDPSGGTSVTRPARTSS
ncbi:hypothetical protein [uncultured Jatrophihabitans sp.]|uniref:hypothetical protein n=1 Tax=uncultured Jatrophihabitans sp. TaxID=1610747 RepID=UPI0035CAA869